VSFSEAGGALDMTSSQFSESVNISLSEVELEELTMNKDATAQIKAAFIHYSKRNLVSFLVSVGRSDNRQSLYHALFPVRREVLTLVLLKIQFFWDVTLCHWMSSS
jgi:hypothetical protein